MSATAIGVNTKSINTSGLDLKSTLAAAISSSSGGGSNVVSIGAVGNTAIYNNYQLIQSSDSKSLAPSVLGK